jgi:hypothetical protein
MSRVKVAHFSFYRSSISGYVFLEAQKGIGHGYDK